MRKGIRIFGSRPDGVLLCDLGDRQMILVNVVDHVKTAVMSGTVAEKFGPWRQFTETKPSDAVRSLMMSVVEQPGNLVPPSAVGALDFDYRDVTPGPTRQEFIEMLETANLDASAELPQEQNFQDEPAFVAHCLSEIVPAMQGSGVEVSNPMSFCTMLHLERTGVMPRAAEGDLADGPPNVALGVNPGEPAAKEPGDPLASDDESAENQTTPEEKVEQGDEGEGDGDGDAVSAKVAEIDAALNAADDLVNELVEMLGIEDDDAFTDADKSLALSAKLAAIRKFAMPAEPNDAGLPASVPQVPVSVVPHGVPGGAPGIAAAAVTPGGGVSGGPTMAPPSVSGGPTKAPPSVSGGPTPAPPSVSGGPMPGPPPPSVSSFGATSGSPGASGGGQTGGPTPGPPPPSVTGGPTPAPGGGTHGKPFKPLFKIKPTVPVDKVKTFGVEVPGKPEDVPQPNANGKPELAPKPMPMMPKKDTIGKPNKKKAVEACNPTA